MLLTYRGSYYETSATITIKLPQKQDLTTAKYRGVSYNIHKFTTAKNQRLTPLKYRGVTYINGGI